MCLHLSSFSPFLGHNLSLYISNSLLRLKHRLKVETKDRLKINKVTIIVIYSNNEDPLKRLVSMRMRSAGGEKNGNGTEWKRIISVNIFSLICINAVVASR